MGIQTRILTTHTVTRPGAPLRADMTLDDAAQGNIILSDPEGLQLSFDATKIDEIIEVLTSCREVRGMLTQDASQLLVGDIDLL